jgi:S-formylglutathione hydrolase FrmB
MKKQEVDNSKKKGKMKRHSSLWIIVAVALLSLSTRSLPAQVRVDSLYMPSLGRTMKISVLLPSNYDSSRHYPVLYLLHGYSGNNADWSTRTKLSVYVKGMPLIVVMPDAENSWYVDSYTEPRDKFEDYIVNDVPYYIRRLYSVDTTRQAIAGLSMGGYGALVLALRHPGEFRFAGSLSGALSIPRAVNDSSRQPEGALAPSLRKAFGEQQNDFRNEHDVFFLYREVPRDSFPYLYMATGIQDGYRTFLPAQRAFTDLLRNYGAPYEYHEVPGGHDWQLWDREIQPLLKRLREVLKF